MRSPEVLPGQPLMGFITGNALALMSSAVVWQCHSLHHCLGLGKAHRRLTVCMIFLNLKGNLIGETQNLSTCSCLPGFSYFFLFETFDCFKLSIRKHGLTALPILFSNPKRHNAQHRMLLDCKKRNGTNASISLLLGSCYKNRRCCHALDNPAELVQ